MTVSRVVKLSLGLWACNLKHFQKVVIQMLNLMSVDISHSRNYVWVIICMFMFYEM